MQKKIPSMKRNDRFSDRCYANFYYFLINFEQQIFFNLFLEYFE